MKKTQILLMLCIAAFLMLAAGDSDKNIENYWHQWRGPAATGVAPNGNPPVTWSEEKNVRWKVNLPGKGNSSPIIWKDRVYVTAAVKTGETPETVEAGTAEKPKERGRRGRRGRRGVKPTQHQFVIMALDRQSGKMVWEKTLREHVPHEGTHRDGSWAAASPITDGTHLFAYFGSNGLFCLDMDGNVIWEKELGKMQTRRSFGEGSSPALYQNTMVLNWDHEGDSFILALDKNTGKELWKFSRDEVTSWSTPLIVEIDGKPQAIVSATTRTRGYDLETGSIVWEAGGMTTNTVPSPVYQDGVVYVMSGFRGNALQAIKVSGAKGDITGSEAILWEFDRDTPYVPSPLLYNGLLYFHKSNNGILSCFDAKTGEACYGPERLGGIEGVYASPVGAAGRVYLVGINGVSQVISNTRTLEVLAENSLDDRFFASPAIAGNELYLRGHAFLYCIAEN